jgi:hypothetical protein
MNKAVVQFKIDDSTDFDWLLLVEETLTRALALGRLADVDGHNLGEERFSIFVLFPGVWEPVLDRITDVLDRLAALPGAVIAKLDGETGRYEVVHPESYAGEFAL